MLDASCATNQFLKLQLKAQELKNFTCSFGNFKSKVLPCYEELSCWISSHALESQNLFPTVTNQALLGNTLKKKKLRVSFEL